MRSVVRSLLSAPRAPNPPKPSVWDWLLVAVIAGVPIGVLVVHMVVGGDLAAQPFRTGVSAALALVLPWRRSNPLLLTVLAFGVMTAIGIVDVAVGNFGVTDEVLSSGAIAVVYVLTYSLMRWGSGREVAIGVPIIFASHFFCAYGHDPTIVDLGAGAAFWLLPGAIGIAFRYRTETQRGRIERARLNERERLARDLHDSVAHHVSAIAIQAQAARLLASSRPEVAADVLRTIEDAASSTLVDMRKIVGALRNGAAPDTAPPPRIADIERLAGREAVGPRIDVSLSGSLDALEPSVEAALFGLAQESITNARRHARHATAIKVRVEGVSDAVRLTVTDDGDVCSHDPSATRGFGLVGMKERAALLGGRLEAGPISDGGWVVRALLPTTGG